MGITSLLISNPISERREVITQILSTGLSLIFLGQQLAPTLVLRQAATSSPRLTYALQDHGSRTGGVAADISVRTCPSVALRVPANVGQELREDEISGLKGHSSDSLFAVMKGPRILNRMDARERSRSDGGQTNVLHCRRTVLGDDQQNVSNHTHQCRPGIMQPTLCVMVGRQCHGNDCHECNNVLLVQSGSCDQ